MKPGEKETCSWRMDDGTYCGATADAFRTKHWPRQTTWWYCRLHAYVLRSIAGERPRVAA
jgi:hypothetical protein